VGGLFGVAIHGLFAGESMFNLRADAAAVALAHLVERLRSGGFVLLDTRFVTATWLGSEPWRSPASSTDGYSQRRFGRTRGSKRPAEAALDRRCARTRMSPGLLVRVLAGAICRAGGVLRFRVTTAAQPGPFPGALSPRAEEKMEISRVLVVGAGTMGAASPRSAPRPALGSA